MITRTVITSAVALAFAMGATAEAGPAPRPKFEAEKCYGIAKAGRNDCETRASSCAGTSRRDNQADAWIYVPKGTCDRIVNASLQPK
jgi:uncharacterized membrane protein